MADVFDDLDAEYRRLDAVLASLAPEQWSAESGAAGWTVADVVLHLAQAEEGIGVLAPAAGEAAGAGADTGVGIAAGASGGADGVFLSAADTMDGVAADMVAAERGTPPAEILARWREAAFATPGRLRAQPPGTRLPWVRTSLSPRTLATTRLAEHWAHGLDITVPLGIDHPDTARIRHIAWLGHRTLPYAFSLDGLPAVPVFCDLTGPDGDRWTFGDPAAATRITGSASEFCRVGARRLAPERTGLVAEGPQAADALRLLRNYAA
ncbi:maleylpyruvate isomerase family mycothiol-dependent enzyme [Actinomadura fibrosa]|uniref:Maleylpyruvate isomerase family mycothiol-dependent enzyme n=1 Tax=Actinomadura fibrosa TaxID=111802 RepID=A0ABW2XWZ9_9ACTN|nr:maleylpyruvate isomerase family mycothiol-dependent enzyme [Actinomadura fibrosa]